MRRLRMAVRACLQRHRNRLLTILGVSFLLIIVYCFHKKLLYIERNLPFSTKTISVPYEADYRPIEAKVPRIIHQTWIDANVPKHFSSWMKSWSTKHPDHEYWFWTDADARELIRRKYPGFLHLFDSYPFNIQRADVIRYFILYEYGGIYSDLDVEVLRSIDDILDESCYLSQEPLEHAYFFWGLDRLACNAIMACRPRHPFFKQVIENLKYYKGLSVAPFLKVSMPVMESSGPKMITYNLDTYKAYGKLNEVTLWPAEYFFPDADASCMPYVKRKCSDASRRAKFTDDLERVCRYHEKTQYSNKAHENPYAIHHWSHTYYGLEKRAKVAIGSVLENVRYATDVLQEEFKLNSGSDVQL